MAAIDSAMVWDVMALQEIITQSETEHLVTTGAGHIVAIAPRRRGQHSTAIAVHRRLTPSVLTYGHHERLSTCTLRTTHSSSHNTFDIQIVNIHLPSSIGHTIDELDDVLRKADDIIGGKRHIRVLMGDFNTELRTSAPALSSAAP